MSDTTTRPLWRIGTKTLAEELRRRAAEPHVQRAMLAEMPMDIIVEGLARRGYVVVPFDRAHGRVEYETTKLWDGERWLVCVPQEASK